MSPFRGFPNNIAPFGGGFIKPPALRVVGDYWWLAWPVPGSLVKECRKSHKRLDYGSLRKEINKTMDVPKSAFIRHFFCNVNCLAWPDTSPSPAPEHEHNGLILELCQKSVLLKKVLTTFVFK